MVQSRLSLVRRKLLRWYDKNRRDLPWRVTRDPYAIWIAETMLQQTQVKTVLRYYERFLRALPTIDALHRAPLRKILALWSGLGYYQRAENLKKAAQEIVSRHGGEIPKSYDTLRSLPGIGDYTAGALMSIAFNQPFPALDGNARRVLKRIFGTAKENDLREVATRLVSRSPRPGYFNQALMELGATICTAQSPRCEHCPVAPNCAGRLSASYRPMRAPAKTRGIKNVDWPLAIICNNRKILLRRRTTDGILAGLWEIPGGERRARETGRATLHRHLHGLNGALKLKGVIGKFRHSITNRRISSSVFLFSVLPGAKLQLPSRSWRWFAPATLTAHPAAAMTHKAIRILATHEKIAL